MVTQVDRATHCIVGWDVVVERSYETLQPILDRSPQAQRYYSDNLATYDTLVYFPGRHLTAPGKSQTYSVEADNSVLRHYLARLARSSRCFSRSLLALWTAIKLFVFAWNRRQMYKRRFPSYPAHVKDFVYP
ncbi:MAG TPA: IS1 family transposase [Chloroflexi bacterium]|nr:IS1 family transposase [Chloroflexota bacterium]